MSKLELMATGFTEKHPGHPHVWQQHGQHRHRLRQSRERPRDATGSNGSHTQVFINEFGNVVQGNWINPTQSNVAAWGNDLATFRPGKINWSDGSVWKQVSNTPLVATVTDYINAGNGLRAHVVANGTNSLAFINEFGGVVLGALNNPTQATVGAWGNDVATFSAGVINWSDGSVWNLTTAAAPQVTVTHYINFGNQGSAYLIQRPGGSAQIFINEFGQIVLAARAASNRPSAPGQRRGDVQRRQDQLVRRIDLESRLIESSESISPAGIWRSPRAMTSFVRA